MSKHCGEALLRSDGNGSKDLAWKEHHLQQCGDCVGFHSGRSSGCLCKAAIAKLRNAEGEAADGQQTRGTRGRALSQQQDYNSPSSSIEVTSLPQRYQGSNEEDGGYEGRSPNSEEGQMELPTLRYWLPCPQANSTLVVSVTIEPGVPQNTEAEPLPDGQRSSREDSPIACLPVGVGTSWLAPGRELGPDLAHPATNCDQATGPSTIAGPSRPAQEGSPDAVIQLSDSEDSLRFGCRIEEAPQTTDDE